MAESLTSPTSLAVRENKANDKESTDAVATDDEKQFPDVNTIIVSKILDAFHMLQKLTDDFELKLAVAEKNSEKLTALSKRVQEKKCRLQYQADLSNAPLTGSRTLVTVKVTGFAGLVAGIGFAGLVAGTLVGFLFSQRR